MPSLKTEGFDSIVVEVAGKARLAADAAKVVRIALTLDDRCDEASGLRALTPADRVVAESVLDAEATLTDDGSTCLFLTPTGRLTARLDGEPAPDGARLIGSLSWPEQQVAALRSRYRGQRDQTTLDLRRLHAELAAEPSAATAARIDRIEYAVVHLAPIRMYVDDHVYSNLGKLSNLPGKSLSAGHPRSLLTRLRATPAVGWCAAEACFVACLDVLLTSGPPVRAEEFNGAQLTPGTLYRFLTERIAEYGDPARPGPAAGVLARLAALAAECGRLRRQALTEGQLPFRVINGLTLHKREHLMTAPVTLGEAPGLVRAHVSDLLRDELPAATGIEELDPRWAALAQRLQAAPAPDGFSSAFEAVLHGFLTVVAEAFAADVSMSRGPQRFDSLRAAPGAGADPLRLITGDFYCCVTPRRAFTLRFSDDRAGLVRTLAAYSARMRFNTWHYLPHTLGIADRAASRPDWFFAPTMPDLTDWSDQHHTGHVAFGVRYAIRVPIGIEYDGRPLPGLYDLRVMRTGAPPFTFGDLRRAVAAGLLLRQLYQAMSGYRPLVTDFGKSWYEGFHR